MDLLIPSCCGSEDGEVIHGVDPARDYDTMITLWSCNTCGHFTIVSMVQMQHSDGPPA